MSHLPTTVIDLDKSFSRLAGYIGEVTQKRLGEIVAQISFDQATLVSEFTEQLSESVRGGKRFRALSALVGAACTTQATTDTPTDSLVASWYLPGIQSLAAALELYQASALIHDDVIDRADHRRGQPAFHRALAQHHTTNRWLDQAEHFGVAGAILGGDLLLSAADGLVGTATPDPTRSQALSTQFTTMASEVAFGQYLDLRATHTPLQQPEVGVQQATTVVRLKSARYSVVHPVMLGAIHQGADDQTLRVLEEIFEPVGIAFQLRDDHLGVFGDPQVTGKPTGSDIFERKRTVLLALTRLSAPPATHDLLQTIYSRPDAPGLEDIVAVTDAMAQFGVPPHEDLIQELTEHSLENLRRSALSDNAKALCQSFIRRLVSRQE